MNKTSLILLITGISLQSFADYRLPQDPNKNKVPPVRVGIGDFEQNQILVIKFMRNVGWDDNQTYEETGFRIKDLLNKLMKNNEAKAWLTEVVAYFESPEFKKQSPTDKKKDIFQAKIAAKMYIQEEGLLDSPKYSVK